MGREAFLAALGYASPHGAAMKTLAALRGYGLVERRPGELRISALGLDLLKPEGAESHLPLLRRAALSPRMFRKIWRWARDLAAPEIEEMLLLRGFTEKGAEKASTVYAANSRFARLDEMETEPDFPAERGGRGRAGRMDAGRRQNGPPMRPKGRDGLSLPLSAGRAFIPSGLSESDFEVLMQTLRIWKPRLIGAGGTQ
jgi:hypothetical protein